MNLKVSYEYQMYDHKKPIAIYYIVVSCVILFLLISVSASSKINTVETINMNINGIEMASAIFLFVAALGSFREVFGMLLQNGCSRKILYEGRTLTTISIAAIMAVLDQIIGFVSKSIIVLTQSKLKFSTLYEMVYSNRSQSVNLVRKNMEDLLFTFVLYVSFMSIGYLITVVFYRLNKTGRTVLAAGLPIGVFAVLPMVDSLITNGRMGKALLHFFTFAFGVTKQQPIYGMVTCGIVFLVFSLLSWFTIRRVDIRG